MLRPSVIPPLRMSGANCEQGGETNSFAHPDHDPDEGEGEGDVLPANYFRDQDTFDAGMWSNEGMTVEEEEEARLPPPPLAASERPGLATSETPHLATSEVPAPAAASSTTPTASTSTSALPTAHASHQPGAKPLHIGGACGAKPGRHRDTRPPSYSRKPNSDPKPPATVAGALHAFTTQYVTEATETRKELAAWQLEQSKQHSERLRHEKEMAEGCRPS